jgi:RNA polymerase sigma factor (sigma-70 family)
MLDKEAEPMRGDVVTAGRRRAAIELIAREGGELSKTARRYSLCAEDAEDACQRALEILLTKAPSERPRDLIRWTKTVVKHEALAIRRNRERLLGTRRRVDGEESDPIELVPAREEGPAESLELSERVARSREALRALKPAELRSLTLLAAGYSYAEIGEMTGFSRTKVNRSLAEGRERFRSFFSRSEDGRRCLEMGPLLSAFCDGEAGAEDADAVREHLRACGACRATVRAYRAAPGAVAALAPAAPASRSLLERGQEFAAWLHSRLAGADGSFDAGIAQAAAGGTRGTGMAALAKALAICAGTVGGAAACVATGVAPSPLDLVSPQPRAATVERVARQTVEEPVPPSAEPGQAAPERQSPSPEPQAAAPSATPEPVAAAPTTVEAGAVEYTAPPPAPPVTSEASAASSGSAAGEFGP